MNHAYLSLGSNEGNRTLWLQKAIDLIAEKCGVIGQRSSIYETAAWGITTQPDFLNMVISLQTDKTATELLALILAIETSLGRERTIKWGPRTIDIDILLYNKDIIQTSSLIVPHPFMQERRFTLIPLAEIAPHFIHPILRKSIAELLVECPDKLEVWKYSDGK